jgi:hypothetical protein
MVSAVNIMTTGLFLKKKENISKVGMQDCACMLVMEEEVMKV